MELQEKMLREIIIPPVFYLLALQEIERLQGSDDFESHIVTKAACSGDGFITAVKYFKC